MNNLDLELGVAIFLQEMGFEAEDICVFFSHHEAGKSFSYCMRAAITNRDNREDMVKYAGN